uniref:Protein kinase domain-containing protein n=1 Tax=Lotharella oceanica TaxID=641309 RepID=A0A7S2X7I8_9EUKA|mmetsp:Transcript_15296/g.29087  ORF Transcript_15296/g.29087 Transcript_15296/m.29087 type:complete len:315 (+) Transcript_15296:191-1135(+)
MKFTGFAFIKGKLCLLTKLYTKGSLDNLHRVEDLLQKERFRRLASDVCSGVAHLHAHNIIHRDLACRNLFMGHDGTVVVGDYGLARKMDDRYMLNNSSFPWAWTAPESLATKEFTSKSDIWSLGIIFWEIATQGQHPYGDSGCSTKEIIRRIIRSNLKVELPYGDRGRTLPPCLRALFHRSTEFDPASRPTASQLLELLSAEEESVVKMMSRWSAGARSQSGSPRSHAPPSGATAATAPASASVSGGSGSRSESWLSRRTTRTTTTVTSASTTRSNRSVASVYYNRNTPPGERAGLNHLAPPPADDGPYGRVAI